MQVVGAAGAKRRRKRAAALVPRDAICLLPLSLLSCNYAAGTAALSYTRLDHQRQLLTTYNLNLNTTCVLWLLRPHELP